MNKITINILYKMRILSYNISWECMTNSSQGSAGRLGQKCKDDVCLKNVSNYLNFVNKKIDYLDFILLQEAANYNKLFGNIDNFDKKYDYISSRSGREYMVTCYKKKYKLIKSIKGSFVSGRPYHILVFKDLILINLHYCGYNNLVQRHICDIQKEFSSKYNSLGDIKNKQIIIGGDFNYPIYKYKSFFQLHTDQNLIYFKPFNQIERYVFVKNVPKTCCSTSVNDDKKMHSIGDFIMTEKKSTTNKIYYRNIIKGLSSDHMPIFCQI